MTDYIGGNPPATKVISLTKGADKVITLRRKDSEGEPLDWDAAVWIDIDINRTEPTRIDGGRFGRRRDPHRVR